MVALQRAKGGWAGLKRLEYLSNDPYTPARPKRRARAPLLAKPELTRSREEIPSKSAHPPFSSTHIDYDKIPRGILRQQCGKSCALYAAIPFRPRVNGEDLEARQGQPSNQKPSQNPIVPASSSPFTRRKRPGTRGLNCIDERKSLFFSVRRLPDQ